MLDQIANGELPQPSWLQPTTAKVAVIGSLHSHFEFDDIKDNDNTHPTVDHILQALQTVQDITSNYGQDHSPFNFLVCALPAAALHPDVLPFFMQTIYSLLGKRYSVHIQKAQLPRYGILIEKSMIVIVASPICAAPQWVWNQSELTQTTIDDVIGDLGFQNPRRSHPNHEGESGFKCKMPFTENDTIYNHDTNNPAIPGVTQPIVMSSTVALKLPFFRDPSFLHPSKF